MRFLDRQPRLNWPPTHTEEAPAPRADTPELAPGFHSEASPLIASSAATELRPCPPTLVNDPHAKTEDPLRAMALTGPSAFGSQEVAAPLTTSNATSRLRVWIPTVTNAPPA